MGGIPTGKGREKIDQHLVVVLLAFILTAVIVDQVAATGKLDAAAVGQTTIHRTAACFNILLQSLQKRRLAIACIAGDQHQTELAGQHRRQQCPVEGGIDIGRVSQGIHAARTRIAASALAIERDQV
ncbi:MAG: hypothetical protein AW09_003969 [Candidatus Accumulibacter phosphatis]|uniref:Uncharacterized protein n=1 Tax=Candidatus Accumulibacter phosphatis TaxID=327160 RepID=A0A080LRN2_9PROT|nr:MAG: hypothetical protein AW09_003969 [Candidatus Accumulibacter phosphatis]